MKPEAAMIDGEPTPAVSEVGMPFASSVPAKRATDAGRKKPAAMSSSRE